MAKLNDPADIKREFRHVVNMTPARLEKWLATEESKSVGWDSGDGESIGHKSGRKIIRIKRKPAASLTDADLQHMRKVIGYVHRHLKQRPKDVKDSRWRYALMNWGHDPMQHH